MGIVAKVMNRPFYVVTESCKFSRLFPLTQADIPLDEIILSEAFVPPFENTSIVAQPRISFDEHRTYQHMVKHDRN